MRKGREGCHSCGRVNRRVQSHLPIPDQTARGSRDASSTAGSSRAHGNARLSCARGPWRPSASSIPAPAVSILAYHRVRFPEILPSSPRYKARGARGREGEGSRTAPQLHSTLPPPWLRPSSPSPLVLLQSALPHSARSLPTHANQPPPSRLHRRRRTAGEGDVAGKRRRLWLAGARGE